MPHDDDRCIHIRRGKIELSKYWPDGTRYRRVFRSKDEARKVRTVIEAAIHLGTWRDLKEQLTAEPEPPALTFNQFKDIFLEHCRNKGNTRCDFHEEEIDRFLPIIGNQALKDFTRADAVQLQEWRGRSVKPATVNRMMAVLQAMLSYAVKRGNLLQNPMQSFGAFREEPRMLRVMTINEERAFVVALLRLDTIVGVYAGLMGETALRTSEAERLEWRHLDMPQRLLTIDHTKGKRPRAIPISDFCKDLLGLVRQLDESPFVFTRLDTLKPIHDVRAPFEKAQRLTGLTWVHPEDFRHFRATQWVRQKIDLKTVQGLLGHADIHTTMRYAHFAPDHAARSIVEAQRDEAATLRQLMAFTQDQNRNKEVSALEQLYALNTDKA